MCNSIGPCWELWQFNGPKIITAQECAPIMTIEDRLFLHWDRIEPDEVEVELNRSSHIVRSELLCCGLSMDGTDGLIHYFLCCNGKSVQRYGGDIIL